MAVYVTKGERDALLEALDFISSNSDVAEDQEYYQWLCSRLISLYKKAKEEDFNRKVKSAVKRKLKTL